MEAGAYNRLGKEIVSGLLFPLDIHVSALGWRSLLVVWILMVFSSWEISTPRVFSKGGMDRCYPRSETTLESSTTVSIQSASPAIGSAGVRMALAQSAELGERDARACGGAKRPRDPARGPRRGG
jgi:hypothetical protein